MDAPLEFVRLTPEQALAGAQAAIAAEAPREQRASGLRLASLAPFPGPLRAVAAPTLRTLFGAPLRPLCPRHLAALVAVDSPLLEGMRLSRLLGAAETPEEKARLEKLAAGVRNSTEDIAAVLFIFSATGAELEAILSAPRCAEELKTRGRALFTPYFQPLTDWATVSRLLGAHYESCFATRLLFEPRQSDRHIFIRQETIEDGLGWLLPLISLMLREFHLPRREVWNDLSLAEAFALESSYYMTLPHLELAGRGYLGAEAASDSDTSH